MSIGESESTFIQTRARQLEKFKKEAFIFKEQERKERHNNKIKP